MLHFARERSPLKVRLRAMCCVFQYKRLRAGAKVGSVRRRVRVYGRLWSPMLAVVRNVKWWGTWLRRCAKGGSSITEKEMAM